MVAKSEVICNDYTAYILEKYMLQLFLLAALPTADAFCGTFVGGAGSEFFNELFCVLNLFLLVFLGCYLQGFLLGTKL